MNEGDVDPRPQVSCAQGQILVFDQVGHEDIKAEWLSGICGMHQHGYAGSSIYRNRHHGSLFQHHHAPEKPEPKEKAEQLQI